MDNTVVVVTTDNGGGPWDSNAPLRGTKVRKVCYAVYDHAVCYIVVWWPWEWYSNVPLRGTKVSEKYFWFSEKVLCSTEVRNCPFSGNPLRGRYQRGCFRSFPPTGTSWDLQVRLSLYHLCFTSYVFPGTLLYLIRPFWIWDRPIIFTHNPNPGGWCIIFAKTLNQKGWCIIFTHILKPLGRCIIFTQTLNPGVSCTWQTGCLPCWALLGLNHHPVRFPFFMEFFFFFLGFFFSLKQFFPGWGWSKTWWDFIFFFRVAPFYSSVPSSPLFNWINLAGFEPQTGEISFSFFVLFLFPLLCLLLFSWTE